MSERSDGQRMPMLSSAGASAAVLQGPDAPSPVKSGREPDQKARQGMLLKAEHLAGIVKDNVAPYTGKAADGLQQAGSYLQRGTIGGIVEDVTGFMSRHPVPVMLTGVALGFTLARKLHK